MFAEWVGWPTFADCHETLEVLHKLAVSWRLPEAAAVYDNATMMQATLLRDVSPTVRVSPATSVHTCCSCREIWLDPYKKREVVQLVCARMSKDQRVLSDYTIGLAIFRVHLMHPGRTGTSNV